jgi:OOP family OmpA-OmpF porin
MLPVVVAEAKALFDFDSAELTSLGRETLDSWLATAPVGMPVLISGHADRLGPEPYNLELSLRRAMAARDYLVAHGKDARDIRIVAKGELEPVKQCRGGPNDATKACLAPNRRVLITPE